MLGSYRGTRLEVRTNIIKENAKVLKALAGDGFFCTMIKANAYGHGVDTVAKALNEIGVKNFGVATWDEAIEIRLLGFKNSILVFSRIHNREEGEIIFKENLIPVLSRMEDLEILEALAENKNTQLSVHVKFDTGIHRMGFPIEEREKVFQFFSSTRNLKLVGLLSHLSHGSDLRFNQAPTHNQLAKFMDLISFFKSFSPQVHLLNTMALLEGTNAGLDVTKLGARPGIGLYGAVPDSRLSQIPALRVVTKIDHLQKIKRGEGVSYGWNWTADKDSVVGVVPIGYGDGYLRSAGNKGFVLVHEKRVPIVGSVCMDYILIDLTELSSQSSIQLNDEVVVLGEQGKGLITPMDLAEWFGTIPYEVLTSLGVRKNRMGVV